MSGTAPNDAAPGDRAAADGIQQSSLGDADQHGQPRNAVNEAKDTTATTTHDTPAAAGHHAGEAGDAGDAGDGDGDGAKNHKGALSGLVDNIVNKALGFGGASEAAERKAEADHHHHRHHHHPPGRHP